MRVNIYERTGGTAFSPGAVPVPEDYRTTFRGHLDVRSLEGVYAKLAQGDYPTTYQGNGLRVGDIVELVDDIPSIIGYVDRKDPETHLLEHRSVFYDSEAYESEIRYCERFGLAYAATDLRDRPIPAAETGQYLCLSEGWCPVSLDTRQIREMEGLKCLYLAPGEEAVTTFIRPDLESLQRAVSESGEDSLIEISYPLEDGAVVIGNEEARLLGMEGNRHIGSLSYAGPVFIVGDNGYGELCDLNPSQLEKYGQDYRYPEDLSREETAAECGYRVLGWC